MPPPDNDDGPQAVALTPRDRRRNNTQPTQAEAALDSLAPGAVRAG